MNEPTPQPEQPAALVLDAQAVKKVRDANIVNILRKVKSDKPLTVSEAKLIEDNAVQAASVDGWKWPVYGSYQQCAGATGWPIEVLRDCKRAGCPAFRHGRIHYGELPAWYFAKMAGIDASTGTPPGGWKAYREQWSAKMAKLDHDKAAGLLIEKAKVVEAIATHHGAGVANMRTILMDQAPPVLSGLSPEAIRSEMPALVDRICEGFQIKLP